MAGFKIKNHFYIFNIIFLLIILNQFGVILNEPILFKSLRFIQDGFYVDFDSYHVDFFRKINENSSIYEFSVKREVDSFYIDMFVRWNTKDKEVYRVTNMDGCVFLNNPLMNRLFYNFYKNLLVNATLFTCPIKRGLYYLRTEISKSVMPAIHPKGNFTFNVRIKNGTLNDGVLLDFRWIYRFVKAKGKDE